MEKKTRIIVVDDFRISREFLRMYVSSSKDNELVGAFSSAEEAVRFCDGNAVDLVIMDIMMRSGIDGLTAAGQIKRRHPRIKILLVTSMAESNWEAKARELGVEGFWYKEYSPEPLEYLIRHIAQGEICYPQRTPDVSFGQSTKVDLTEREQDILRELIGGSTNEEIAQKLMITVNTVKYHIERSNVTCGPIYGNDSIFLGDCALVKPEGGSIRTGNPEKGEPDASLGAHIVDADGQLAKYVVVRVNPFEDVAEDKYYYDPIIWAFYHWPVQITNGVDSTHFAPGKTCTRGQIVTFLWRARDCPEPETTQSPFTDVTDPKAYYYKAVLWAVANGVTSGTDKTHFSPNKPCTRGQVVTFMWRADGSPAPRSSDNPFKDVGDGFYHDAVLWAVEEGITKGVKPDSFAPNATCTRGQIVTFLERNYSYPLG